MICEALRCLFILFFFATGLHYMSSTKQRSGSRDRRTVRTQVNLSLAVEHRTGPGDPEGTGREELPQDPSRARGGYEAFGPAKNRVCASD